MLHVENEARILFLLSIIGIISYSTYACAMSSLTRHDPYPMFTSDDPHHFNYTNDTLLLMDLIDKQDYWKEHVTISVSPFGQNAYSGRELCGERFVGGFPVLLGDIAGRWNMIALLLGQPPQGQTLPPLLQNAQDTIFPVSQFPRPIDDEQAIDPQQLFGCFSIPLKYRQRGVRFEAQAQIIGDFGITLQGGVASISQCLQLSTTINTPSGFIDLTPNANNLMGDGNVLDKTYGCTDITVRDVECLLMEEIYDIAEEIRFDINNFSRVSIEDIRLQLYWRHAYRLTPCTADEYAVLATPYFQLGGSLAAAKKINPSAAFALSTGNNDHNAVGFTGGINFDFASTLEFGAEVGVTHFFSRDFCNVPVPNNEFQSGIYPFKTDINVQPGLNWHFAGKIAAYHFMECLSFWFQYVIMEHQHDKICLKQADPAFKPRVLEERSHFQAKFVNSALNYDISPNIAVGFLWQAPIGQKNSYRSTTVVLSIIGTF
jgi:hypothetical protein